MISVKEDGGRLPGQCGWAARLQAFQALIADESETLGRQLGTFLAMAADQFAADFCTALRIEGTHFIVLASHGAPPQSELKVDDTVPLDGTFAHLVQMTGTTALAKVQDQLKQAFASRISPLPASAGDGGRQRPIEATVRDSKPPQTIIPDYYITHIIMIIAGKMQIG